MTIEIIQLEYI